MLTLSWVHWIKLGLVLERNKDYTCIVSLNMRTHSLSAAPSFLFGKLRNVANVNMLQGV